MDVKMKKNYKLEDIDFIECEDNEYMNPYTLETVNPRESKSPLWTKILNSEVEDKEPLPF
jgi:hypothetical protein